MSRKRVMMSNIHVLFLLLTLSFENMVFLIREYKAATNVTINVFIFCLTTIRIFLIKKRRQ